jgi:hypothetical protein
MTWLMEFYNERQGVLARYHMEARLPAEAVVLGRKALLAEYPSRPRTGWRGLFEQAQRTGGQDSSGWVLYRIVKDGGQGAPDVARAHAA